METKTYSEKLKDPRWQKKRLKILERDNWTCQRCNNQDKTLHVHHVVYLKDKEPWDYIDTMLVTICWDCHEELKDFDITGFILEWVFRAYDPKTLYALLHISKPPLNDIEINGQNPEDVVFEFLSIDAYCNKKIRLNNG